MLPSIAGLDILQLVCLILLPCGCVGVMQLVCSILLPSGYVGAAYVLKIRNRIIKTASDCSYKYKS